jgi:hypothetical protein
MKRTKTRILLCILLCLTLISSNALPLFADYQAPKPLSSPQKVSGESKNTNGEYVVSAFRDGQWKEAGRLGYDMFLKEKSLDLSSVLAEDGPVAVRIVQEGGEAAHLDSVFLGGETPQSVNFNDELLLEKLSKKDLDLINVTPEGIELIFPANRSSNIIFVTGRIEGENISKEPFNFPKENNFRPIDKNSKFYTYKLGSVLKSLEVDGNIAEVAGTKPFFKEYCVPVTGHPEGFTYGWVMNDEEYLYAVIDFTPDNTMDGDKDYSKLYVKTNAEVTEFKVSVPETNWGSPGFIYTDKVGYQHKVYEFKIPLSAIGYGSGDSIQLSFSAYGTAATYQLLRPAIAYNSETGKYLVVYESNYQRHDIHGRFADENAEWISDSSLDDGDPFVMNDEPFTQVSNRIYSETPEVVYDSVNDRFLVVWLSTPYEGYPMILGQLLNGDGSKVGENFVISQPLEWSSYNTISIAYNNIDQEYLVVWGNSQDENGDILGRLISSDGMVEGDEDIDICTSLMEQSYPCVEYSPEGNVFMVVWQDDRNDTNQDDGYSEYDIYGCLVNAAGNVVDDDFRINSYAGTEPEKLQVHPSITYNSSLEKLLVAWSDSINNSQGRTDAIYGRYVNFDEDLSNPEMEGLTLIFQEDEHSANTVSVEYNSEKILTTWSAYYKTYGLLSAHDDFYSEPRIELNDSYGSFQANASAAANTELGNFVVAYSSGVSYGGDEPQVRLQLIGDAIQPNPGKLQFEFEQHDTNEADGIKSIKVKRTDGSAGRVSVKYTTKDLENSNSATPGEDYTHNSNIVIFEDGQTEKTFDVAILNDEIVEDYEYVALELSEPTGGAELGSIPSTILRIDDDDSPNVRFSSSTYTTDEDAGFATITVRFSGFPEQQLEVFSSVYEEDTVFSVVYETIDGIGRGSALPNDDYGRTSGTMDFGLENENKTFNVPIVNDDDPEGAETIKLKLSFEPKHEPYLDNITGKYTIYINDYPVILSNPYQAELTINANDPHTPQNPNPRPDRDRKTSTVLTPPPVIEAPPPTEGLPNDALVDRMPGYVTLCTPTKINEIKNEISLSYNKTTLASNPGHDARIYYWKPDVKKWVALATYPDGDDKVKAINDGGYKGWFVVFGVVQPHFSDVSTSWAEQLINRMNGLGLIEGYTVMGSDLRVAKPEQKVTRAEFTMFVTRIMNMNPDNILLPSIPDSEVESILSQSYTDAAEITPWARTSVAKATKAGLIPFEGSNFKPLEPITRIEAAVMVSRALKKFKDFKTIDLTVYKDSSDIPGWAVGQVVENALEGYPDNTLKPNVDIARAESLAMLLRLFIKGLGW